MSFLSEYESIVRLSVFIGVLVLMGALEALLPRRSRTQKQPVRWATNLGLIVVDSIALRLALPLVATGMAALAAERGWGLFNILNWPSWLEFVLAIVLLDMLIYWQHVASHHIPILWRLHKVHHADRDIDTTTGIRFHPVEIILSMVYKIICVVLLGPAVVAVILFEVILNGCALFNHANVRLPESADKMIRRFLVTPDMHRVHHSVIVRETNSNYGFSLSIWDRLFGSYIAQPSAGHDTMTIGLTEYQSDEPSNIFWALVVPFKRNRQNTSTGRESRDQI